MAVSSVDPSGDAYVDGLLYGQRWTSAGLTYGFPTGAAQYSDDYETDEEPWIGFETLNATQRAAVTRTLEAFAAVANLSFTLLPDADAGAAVLRFGMTDDSPTAHAYLPHPHPKGGDSWYNNSGGQYDDPVLGNYAWITFFHEIGHALGLKHPHESRGGVVVPADRDWMAYTVMTYRAYENAPLTGYPNETFGFAQTLMMLDIAAVQHMYGANFAHNDADNVYRWDPATGEMSIDGVGQGAPGANRVFMTVWDGGGTDTYDLSDRPEAVTIDLRPGRWTIFGSGAQTADLNRFGDEVAPGNVANALLYKGDTRSLIENAIGGAGDDFLYGNQAANALTGGAGDDLLDGAAGDDLLMVQHGGSDTALGGEGDDAFYFGAAFDSGDGADGGAGSDELGLQGSYAIALSDAQLAGIEVLAFLSGSDARFGDTAGNLYNYSIVTADGNIAAGQRCIVNWNSLQVGENVTLDCSAETDGTFLTFAGFGIDTITGGAGSDAFYFGEGDRFTAADRIDGGGGDDQLGLRGDYSAQLVFTADTIAGIETIALLSARDVRFGAEAPAYGYSIRTHDSNVAAGAVLTVSATGLAADETLFFDGSLETDGAFRLRGGAGDDQLAGGAGEDELFGGAGSDRLEGGGGADRFLYRGLAESTAAASDSILDFAAGDRIDLSVIDAVAGGGDDAFRFIGDAAFSGGAGELRAVQDGADWRVEADIDGDGIADLVIAVTTADGHMLAAGDFVF